MFRKCNLNFFTNRNWLNNTFVSRYLHCIKNNIDNNGTICKVPVKRTSMPNCASNSLNNFVLRFSTGQLLQSPNNSSTRICILRNNRNIHTYNKSDNRYQSVLISCLTAICCSIIAYFGYFSFNNNRTLSVKAASSDKDEDVGEEKKNEKKKSLRTRQIIHYEDRIRTFSSPEKIFRYFATLKVYPKGEKQHGPNFEVFMTPEDFVRCFTPGVQQPEGLGLDQFDVFDPEKFVSYSEYRVDDSSAFIHLGQHGLASFNDYILMLTILLAPAKDFADAFKACDINRNGEIDSNEFEMVKTVVRQTNPKLKHFEHVASGTIFGKRQSSSNLDKYFFGPNNEKKLTIDKLLNFRKQLKEDVLKIEELLQ